MSQGFGLQKRSLRKTNCEKLTGRLCMHNTGTLRQQGFTNQSCQDSTVAILGFA
jgi:hypothetical protein